MSILNKIIKSNCAIVIKVVIDLDIKAMVATEKMVGFKLKAI